MVADQFGGVEIVDFAHGRMPVVAAVEVQVPIQIEVFQAAQAGEDFRLFAEMADHFLEGFQRVDDRNLAALFEGLEFLEDLDQFLDRVIDQVRIAEAQVGALQGIAHGDGVAEGAAVKAQRGEERRQLGVIVNEAAGGDAGHALDAQFAEEFIGAGDFLADAFQAAVLFVQFDARRIDGHDDAGESQACIHADVLIGPEGAIGADHRLDARIGRIFEHGGQVLVGHRFSADKEEEPDAVFDTDINRVIGFLERDALAGFGVKAVDRESAEIAMRVADVGDGKLEIARSAGADAFLEQRPEAGLAFHRGYGCIELIIWVCGVTHESRHLPHSRGGG